MAVESTRKGRGSGRSDVPAEAERLAGETLEGLEARADPARREFTSGYFPSALHILGVPAGGMREVLRRLVGALRGESPGGVLEVVEHLHRSGVHEARQVAWELLDRRKDARSLLRPKEVRALGKGNDNWASVDGFAVFVAGPLWREGGLGDEDVLAWTKDPDRWWRRTALVSTVPLNLKSRGGKGDSSRTLAVCRALVKDRDPMVVKALSWALRALAQADVASVRTFLADMRTDLPALVSREVGNKLEKGGKNPRRARG